MEDMNKSDLKTISDVMQITQIAIDHYDDIFSDFDPSPYETRLLSEDFLHELSRRYSQKKMGDFIVNFTLPASERSEKTELLIRKRFRDYFKQELKNLEKTQKDKNFEGILRVLVGMLLSASLIIVPELDTAPILTIFSVLIWYAIWSGFERIFESSSRLRRRLIFAEKFMKAKYNFVAEEHILYTMQKLQDTISRQEQKDNQKLQTDAKAQPTQKTQGSS